MRDSIGVIGLGSVGSAVLHTLNKNNKCVGYDVCGIYDWNAILETDFVFVCVPTPLKEGRLDCSIVDSVVERLDDDHYDGVVIIKSTLGMGGMTQLTKKYDLKMAYMPEFLRESNSYSWCEDPDRIVISGDQNICEAVVLLFDFPHKIPILYMTHSEAELGKLAHNAYIATKVSFTNTIEGVSDHCGADPEKVMSVIWEDRRVKNSSHLKPRIGGYSGKCIPKDTAELLGFSALEGLDTSLLCGVESVNASCRPSSTDTPLDVHVIIPTTRQDRLIERAVASVCEQSFPPKSLVIVYDEPLSEDLASIRERFSTIEIDLIPNLGRNNLSCAVNTGLAHLRGKCSDRGFVALLDDDDWWEWGYLQHCTSFARDMKCDWVVSGIIRHDDAYPDGMRQDIPEKISISDFLIGNPNIQGSNLFVKFKSLITAGGFSEELDSTTDRDVCIKLLKIPGISVKTFRNHLVHHDCISRKDRLSSPGSERKKRGLQSFYRKYRNMMTNDEDIKFKERSEKLFGIPPELFNLPDTFCRDVWESVSIDHRGNVFSCCHNKPVRIGNIYENKLQDLVNCESIKEQRKRSLDGCLDCYNNCTWVVKGQRETCPESTHVEYQSLRTITIAFGESCNISCIMCKQRKRYVEDKERLDPEILIKNVDISPFSTIFLTGGEPLFMEECLRYMSYLSKIGKKFGFSTNGMLLNRDFSEFLAPKVNFVTISLNAATKEVHERVNRGSSFETVLTNIEYLKQIRDSKSLEFDIIGRMTLTAESLEDIPSFIRNYRRFGFDKINFGFDKNTVPKSLYENQKFKETLRAKIASELKNFDQGGVDTHRLSILGLTEMKT